MGRRLWPDDDGVDTLRNVYYDLLLPEDAESFLLLGPGRHPLPPGFARRFPRHLSVDLRPADPLRLPVDDGSIDCILAPGTLDSIGPAERRTLLRDSCRALAGHGAMVIEAANPFDLRQFTGRRAGAAARPIPLVRPGRWRRLLGEAGFSHIAIYALARRPSGLLALVCTARGAAAAHYRRDYPPEVWRMRTTGGWLSWLLARLQAMRFAEPSFLILARK